MVSVSGGTLNDISATLTLPPSGSAPGWFQTWVRIRVGRRLELLDGDFLRLYVHDPDEVVGLGEGGVVQLIEIG